MVVEDNDFVVLGAPVDFEGPPSGHTLRVRYENGDHLRIEFREILSLDAACKRFTHMRRDYLESIEPQWPLTFMSITMEVGGTQIKFGPTTTKLAGLSMKGYVSSHNTVGLAFGPPAESANVVISGKVYKGETIYLADLLNKDEQPPQIRGLSFINCQIRGPVVVFPIRTNFNACTFLNHVEEMLFEVPEDSAKVGIVGLMDCTFESCTIRTVGIAGTPEQLSYIRSLFG
jgi:hypothetical protein